MLRRKTDSKIGKYTLSELAKTTSTWIIKKNILCGNLSVKISRIPQGILFPYWHLGFLHLYIRSLTHPHSRTYSFTHLYSLIYTYSHSLIQISCLLYVVGVGQCALLRGWSYSLASLGFRPFFDIPYIATGSPEDWLVAFCDRRENRGSGGRASFSGTEGGPGKPLSGLWPVRQFADGGYRFPPGPLGGVVLETSFGGVSGLSAFIMMA